MGNEDLYKRIADGGRGERAEDRASALRFHLEKCRRHRIKQTQITNYTHITGLVGDTETIGTDCMAPSKEHLLPASAAGEPTVIWLTTRSGLRPSSFTAATVLGVYPALFARFDETNPPRFVHASRTLIRGSTGLLPSLSVCH